MLVLTRKTNQSIMIGDDVEVSVLAVSRDKIRLGITAPREIPVFRKEVYLSIQEEREDGAGQAAVAKRGLPEQASRTPSTSSPRTEQGRLAGRARRQPISQASDSNITTATVMTVTLSARTRTPKATFPRCSARWMRGRESDSPRAGEAAFGVAARAQPPARRPARTTRCSLAFS